MPFDFLVNGELIRLSLGKLLLSQNLSTVRISFYLGEATLNVLKIFVQLAAVFLVHQALQHNPWQYRSPFWRSSIFLLSHLPSSRNSFPMMTGERLQPNSFRYANQILAVNNIRRSKGSYGAGLVLWTVAWQMLF